MSQHKLKYFTYVKQDLFSSLNLSSICCQKCNIIITKYSFILTIVKRKRKFTWNFTIQGKLLPHYVSLPEFLTNNMKLWFKTFFLIFITSFFAKARPALVAKSWIKITLILAFYKKSPKLFSKWWTVFCFAFWKVQQSTTIKGFHW